jgi:hypothetical protein
MMFSGMGFLLDVCGIMTSPGVGDQAGRSYAAEARDWHRTDDRDV